jgi:hypothetical protein
MSADDRVVMTTKGDPPSVSLARLAVICGVDAAQLVRWAWVGRIPPPREYGRRHLWTRTEAQWVKANGGGIPGSFPSLPHYDGLRMLESARVASLRARGVGRTRIRKIRQQRKGGAA